MEIKKTPKADLENKRDLFILLGLVISLGIVLMAFSLNNKVKSANSLGDLSTQAIEDEVIPVTRAEEVKPPPPPPPPKVIEVLTIVDDNTDIKDDFELESSEANDATIIDAVPVINTEENSSEAEEVFVVVEDMPMFPGGEQALRKWIPDHIKYPVIAAENGIQGKVYVQFVVDKDGSVTNAKIARGVDPSLDQEALRVVNSLPKWKPGMQRGKPVRVSFTVPINFQLQ